MAYDTLLIERGAQGVARLTLNRADKHNALSARMIAELTRATAELAAEDDVRAVVLTGAGRSFCAGGDLDWMRRQFSADRAARIAEARALAHMLRDLNTLPKPLIGRVNGTAMGGGLGLMSVCDVAIVASAGKFGFTETRLGLIPATISPYVIARMGEGRARQVFMSARVFDAGELPSLGLAARVVAPADLDSAVAAEVAPYLRSAPLAVAASKQLARSFGMPIDDAVIERSIEALADTWEGAEASEGVAAFFEGRKADWAG